MGIDLLDFYRGKISLRRLLVFVSELPRSSRTITELLSREHGALVEWDQKDYMLADLIDSVRVSNYWLEQNVQMKTDNPRTPKKPVPAYRPKADVDTAPETHEAAIERAKEYASEEQITNFIDRFQPNMPILDE